MEFEHYKDHLVTSTEGTADWRARKAEEYPEDARNRRSTHALEKLAANLKALPADHSKIRALWRLQFGLVGPGEASGEDKSFNLTEILSEELRQYGFHSEDDGDPEVFLSGLLTAFEDELGREAF